MNLVVRNRVYLILDVAGWVLIAAAALALRLDGFGAVPGFASQLVLFLSIAIPCKFLAIWRLGLYQRYWRYASIEELMRVGLAVLGAAGAAAILYLLLEPLLGASQRLPRAVLILDALLTLVYVGGLRFLPRLIDHLRLKAQGRDHWQRVLIAGAGATGAQIARELMGNAQLQLYPVGFVDDNGAKRGSTIQSVPVLGPCDKIPGLAKDYDATTVIIAMPTASGEAIRRIRDICDAAKLHTKIIPSVYEIISGRVRVSHLRDVQIDDLLGRKPVRIDERAAGDLVNGATVLVTGAGGSIGSEICRQVVALGAKEIVLLGHGENSIFDIYHELAAKPHEVRLTPVIADIRDARRLRKVLASTALRPQVIFHAAAHKHVPLMELNPEEAVTNNVVGTANLLAAADSVAASHFVLISTDKAVNPGNVMGATKLVAEQLVHDAAVRTGRAYVSVRFGNVLGSRGSVVPLFQKQIAAGGPLTVTHPDMCRYFMTIPEAVQLVLQAAALGQGGETFVLDMGQPLRIAELAKDLIRLSGFELDRDIKIVYTGLRPGEKLAEELFGGDEEIGRTAHQKIFVVRNGNTPHAPALELKELIGAAESGDVERLRRLLAKLVEIRSGNGRPAAAGKGAHA